MEKRLHLPSLTMMLAGAALLVGGPAYGQNDKHNLLQDAATGKLKPAKIITPNGIIRIAPFFSSGTLLAAKHALDAPSSSDIRADEGDAASGANLGHADLGLGKGSLGCSERPGMDDRDGTPGSIRVNQDCTFRRQAEEKIVFNPVNLTNLLAGQNDSRVGFNQCGIDFSTDNGAHWGDLLPPFRQKLNNPAGQEPTTADSNRHTLQGGPGTLHTYDAGSDPAPAFDSKGRGFFSCIAFDIASNASMVYVVESPLGAQGSFFYNISTFSRSFIVVEDNSPEIVHDKEFIAADTYPSSKNRDNVYVAWTVFKYSPKCGPQPNPAGDERQCSSPIFGSMSTDHGNTWSTPEEISGASPSLCSFGNFFDPTRSFNSCDFNQGADPAVLPNGDLEVIFNNSNTAADNPNSQQLGVHCKPSGSSPMGSAHLNCTARPKSETTLPPVNQRAISGVARRSVFLARSSEPTISPELPSIGPTECSMPLGRITATASSIFNFRSRQTAGARGRKASR